MANANPPSDMMLIVLPVIHKPTNEVVNDKGMLTRTTITLRRSWRKTKIINPVSNAPMAPSVATLLMAARTVGDSSNS